MTNQQITMVNELLGKTNDMDDWSVKFLRSIKKQSYDLTTKQENVLNKMWKKHNG